MGTQTAESPVSINGVEFQAAGNADYWQWVKNGNYNPEWCVYDTYLRPEHTFIDLGAWIGSHSMYASKKAKRIVCVEPDPVAYPILIENLERLNPRPETHVITRAIGAGKMTLGSGCLGASTTRTNPAAGRQIGPSLEFFECEGITLRELVKDFPDPLFIKMDIEGSEEEVFKDVDFFAERKPTVAVELHPFWWKDEAQAQHDFQLVCSRYGNIEHVTAEYYLLHD